MTIGELARSVAEIALALIDAHAAIWAPAEQEAQS